MTLLESLIVLTAVLAALGAGLFAWSYRRLRTTRARLVDYLRTAAPEITVLSPTGVGFRAQVLGTAVDVDLATLARRRPARLTDAQWFDAVIDGIRAQIPTPAVAPYPLVEDRLMPLLKPAAYVALFERYRPALRLAWERFASDLAITYVIAAADRRTTVTFAMLEAWGIDTGALYKRAMDNLRKQTVHLLTELGGPRARYEHIDGYDATRILVADLIVPVDIADPLVAIPEETVLLVAPSSDRSALAAESARRHTGSARPLTPFIFRPESVRSASSGPTATTPTSPSSS